MVGLDIARLSTVWADLKASLRYTDMRWTNHRLPCVRIRALDDMMKLSSSLYIPPNHIANQLRLQIS